MGQAGLKVEQNRFVEYMGMYYENSEQDSTVTEAANQSANTAVKTASTTAKAKKTIQSRKTTLGPSTVSKPAMKKLKQNTGGR